MKTGTKHKKGFTLIEILIVISIISLFASITIVSTSLARAKADNAQTTAQTRQFQTVLASNAANQDSALPDPGDTSTYYCLGKTSAQSCKFWGADATGNDSVYSSLSGDIKRETTGTSVIIDGLEYNDIVYKCKTRENGACTEAAIYWVQSNQTSCAIGMTVVTGDGGVVCGQNAGSSDVSYVELGGEDSVNQPVDNNWCNGSDLNHDGTVDLNDLAIYNNNQSQYSMSTFMSIQVNFGSQNCLGTQFDFSLSQPNNISLRCAPGGTLVAQNSSVISTISGTAEPVSLSASAPSIPLSFTVSLANNPCMPNTSCTATITTTATCTSGISAGTYPIQITGTSVDGTSHSTSYNINYTTGGPQ